MIKNDRVLLCCAATGSNVPFTNYKRVNSGNCYLVWGATDRRNVKVCPYRNISARWNSIWKPVIRGIEQYNDNKENSAYVVISVEVQERLQFPQFINVRF